MFNQLRFYYCFLHNICTTETENLFQNSSSFIIIQAQQLILHFFNKTSFTLA